MSTCTRCGGRGWLLSPMRAAPRPWPLNIRQDASAWREVCHNCDGAGTVTPVTDESVKGVDTTPTDSTTPPEYLTMTNLGTFAAPGKTAHAYEIEVNSEGGRITVHANTRSQAAAVARKLGYTARSVNMVG